MSHLAIWSVDYAISVGVGGGLGGLVAFALVRSEARKHVAVQEAYLDHIVTLLEQPRGEQLPLLPVEQPRPVRRRQRGRPPKEPVDTA